MPAINFPDASASPWFNDPANGGNGVTYEYKNGYWTAIDVTGANAIDIGTGDQRYVQKAPAGNASQNISGNLTINTDKIQLKTDGSITAAGDIQCGVYDPYDPNGSDRGSYFFNTGGMLTNVPTASAGTTRLWSGLRNGVPTSYIQADGGATFTGALEAASIDGGSY